MGYTKKNRGGGQLMEEAMYQAMRLEKGQAILKNRDTDWREKFLNLLGCDPTFKTLVAELIEQLDFLEAANTTLIKQLHRTTNTNLLLRDKILDLERDYNLRAANAARESPISNLNRFIQSHNQLSPNTPKSPSNKKSRKKGTRKTPI
jgi:hypothetical protein